MFRTACARVQQFSHPVVISKKTVSGECSAGVGTFIVVNSEGWILTAWHIIQEINALGAQAARARAAKSQIAEIQSSKALSAKEKRRLLRQVARPDKDDAEYVSVWWGFDGAVADEVRALEHPDVALTRLQPFDPSRIKNYPVFKDPHKDYGVGVNLCRLGFPFMAFSPIWLEDTKQFDINRALPLTWFCNEGLLARMGEFKNADGSQPEPYPAKVIELSTPGLLGQSGGPIFDKDGVIWGMQCQTASYPLDLDTAEQQYFHAGVGTHAETIWGLLTQAGVKFEKSTS